MCSLFHIAVAEILCKMIRKQLTHLAKTRLFDPLNPSNSMLNINYVNMGCKKECNKNV